MLLWTRRSRAVVWAVFGALFALVVAAPLAVIGLAAFARSWRGVLPSSFTTAQLATATSGDTLASLSVSVQTALIAALVAVLLGTWAAVSTPGAPGWLRRIADTLLHLPIAVPSVVIGLSMLVAFSQRPVLLNGTRWIVLLAHLIMVLPFTYSVVSAAVRREDPALAEAAPRRGASPARVLLLVRLPLLLPAMSASAGLGLALSMGELGATIMLYPPDWQTLPVSIFAEADRGQVFLASASTLILLAVTVAGLFACSRIPSHTQKGRTDGSRS
jgi:2-aminoethylphosphonate transport system permease protein